MSYHDRTDTGSAQLLIGICILCAGTALAQSPLENCAEQFIGGTIQNTPTVGNSATDEPFANNKHLCYRDDGVSFFAIEYFPDRFAPRWAAYKLDPANYGTDGCSTFTRAKANCYINADTFEEFDVCDTDTDDDADFFYRDKILTDNTLGSSDFSNTGHDRGHMAPRQAFSWHVCGTHQTFTMANMSPQRAFLNQDIWRHLESQVLTWAFDEGPIFVTTGTIFNDFPSNRFEIYDDDEFEALDPDQIYESGTTLLEAVKQTLKNAEAIPKKDILQPDRPTQIKPDKVKEKVRDMQMPTGYFKVIFRPATDSEDAQAIAFMLPHTFENLNMLVNFFDDLDVKRAFWSFVSRIDLIEETSGITFPGIPEDMKSKGGSKFFIDRDEIKDVRDDAACGVGTPQGMLKNSTLENSTKDDRRKACTDLLE